MSEFNLHDFQNQNLGQNVFFAGMAGFSQRSILIHQQQQVFFQRQREFQALQSLNYQQQEIASIERKRLEIEREQQQIQVAQVRLREAQLKKLKEIRALLADTTTLVTRMRRSESSSPNITLALAVLRSQIAVLDSCEQVFTELSDMQAYRMVRLDYEEFVAEKARAGLCSQDPAQDLIVELERINEVLLQLSKLADDYRELRLHLTNAVRYPLTFNVKCWKCEKSVVNCRLRQKGLTIECPSCGTPIVVRTPCEAQERQKEEAEFWRQAEKEGYAAHKFVDGCCKYCNAPAPSQTHLGTQGTIRILLRTPKAFGSKL